MAHPPREYDAVTTASERIGDVVTDPSGLVGVLGQRREDRLDVCGLESRTCDRVSWTIRSRRRRAVEADPATVMVCRTGPQGISMISSSPWRRYGVAVSPSHRLVGADRKQRSNVTAGTW